MKPNNPKGYSLAELLVAVAIISIAVVVIAAVLRKGAEITTTDGHRSRARALIDSTFESAPYQRRNFDAMANLSRSVLIDPRNEGSSGDDLSGTLTVTVTAESNASAAQTIGYKRVSA